MDQHIETFWQSIQLVWKSFIKSKITEEKLANMLTYINNISPEISKRLDFELTYGEINRIYYRTAKDRIELYISPKLLKDNIPIMDKLYEKAPKLTDLYVYKYRSYNQKDPLISDVEFPDYKYQYSDFGCQTFPGIVDKTPLINIVIFVKKQAAAHLLTQKEVSFINPETSEQTKLLKWLPTKTNVVDILLTNIIGEYNLVNHVGYIEFLPEDDPLIAENSVFHELSDLKKAFQVINSTYKSCQTCGRTESQCKLLKCSNCTVIYCSVDCQKINYSTHKEFCGKS